MRRKMNVLLALFCLFGINAFATDFKELLNLYLENQHKVKTFVAAGSMNVRLINPSGAVIKETSSPIRIHMKYPDLFKLVISEPVEVTLIQQGEYITQKVSGSGGAVTSKVTENSDLFKRYFTYGVETNVDALTIAGHESFIENAQTIQKFSINLPPQSATPECKNCANLNIDRSEIYFNQSGMIIRQVLYNGKNEMMRTEISYVLKDGINIAREISITLQSSGSRVVSTIVYDALNINTAISEKEFEIR